VGKFIENMSREQTPTDDPIESNVRKYETYAKVIIIAGLVGIGIAVFALVRNGLIIPSAKFDFKLLGDLGGLIAGISGLFALGGVLLYYSALRLQAKALFLQRKDIKLNRKALKAQLKEFKNQVKEQRLTRGIFEEQSKTQKLQQFESTFSLLLKNLNDERAKLREKFLNGNYSDPNNHQSYFWSDVENTINGINAKCEKFHVLFDSDKISDEEHNNYRSAVKQNIRKDLLVRMEIYSVYLRALELIIDYTLSDMNDGKDLYMNIFISTIDEWEYRWLYLFSFYYFELPSEYTSLTEKFYRIDLFRVEYINLKPFTYLFKSFPNFEIITSPQTDQ